MWELIGVEIANLVWSFFDNGYFSAEINMTWVVFIPKVGNAMEMNQFRPISMVGYLDKIIAKTLAN